MDCNSLTIFINYLFFSQIVKQNNIGMKLKDLEVQLY